MHPLLPVLAALAVVCTAAAAPLAIVPSGFTTQHLGVATEGSVDDAEAWYPFSRVCPQVLTNVRVTLEILHGDAGDVLALDVPGAGSALVRLGAPVTLEALQGDPCPEFTVRGVDVASAATYRVES